MSGTYVFGIDGGGTKSRMALVDRSLNVIASDVGGSTNPYSVGSEAARTNLFALIESVLARAGVPKSVLAAGCLGSAGLGRKAEQETYRAWFKEVLGPQCRVRLCSDAELLLCGGLHAYQGFCVIAGTGSVAMARHTDGRLTRCGGYGYLLGDEGSAWWIGHEALVRVLRSMEGRDLPSDLLGHLLAACSLQHVDDLVAFVHAKASKADIAALAPTVTRLALAQDPLAVDILHRAAEELVLMANVVARRAPDVEQRELIAAGGVFEHDSMVREAFSTGLVAHGVDLHLVEQKGTALEGACLLAMEQL